MISEDGGGKPTQFMETIANYTDKQGPIRKVYGSETDMAPTPIAGAEAPSVLPSRLHPALKGSIRNAPTQSDKKQD